MLLEADELANPDEAVIDVSNAEAETEVEETFCAKRGDENETETRITETPKNLFHARKAFLHIFKSLC